MKVEFVSYSGKYPCLCYGRLVVRINGKEVSFESGRDCDADYPAFWTSGGNATFEDRVNWEPIVTQDEW